MRDCAMPCQVVKQGSNYVFRHILRSKSV